MSKSIEVSELLAKLQELADVRVVETRELEDGTGIKILRGTLPFFPHGSRPTWYVLVLSPKQTHVDEREVWAILRHFWNAQLVDSFFPADKVVKHSRAALKRK